MFAAAPLRAQEDIQLPEYIPHLLFMGIPIEGSPAAFVESLKQKGFNYVEKKGATYVLTGSFAGNANCAVGVTTKENFVWKVSVSFPTQQSWPAMKTMYEKFKESYTNKYKVKPETTEKLSPRFREGTGQEHWGFEDQSSVWRSVYYLDDGFITLSVQFNWSQSTLFLVAEYVDKVNFMMKEQIDLEDI